MKLRELLTDDGAVSPVIGVILMVAITVILAAVIAAFVLGLGDTNEVAPQVTFNYDYDEASGDLEIAVSGGDAFTAEQVAFEGTGLNGAGGDEWQDQADDSNVAASSSVGSGDRATLSGLSNDFELEMVWTSEGGDESSVISTRTGPEA